MTQSNYYTHCGPFYTILYTCMWSNMIVIGGRVTEQKCSAIVNKP